MKAGRWMKAEMLDEGGALDEGDGALVEKYKNDENRKQ